MARLPGDHSLVGWLPPSYAPYHCFENASSLLTGTTLINQYQQESVVHMYFLTETNLETSIDAARGYRRTSGNRAFKGSYSSSFGCGTAFSFRL